ncbi:MAG: TauD/TfdA dioxygenase family protein [Xanthobacteraceae bacterium]
MTTTATLQTQGKTSSGITVRPLSPALGAEISGVDLRDPIDEPLKQTFLDIWHQYLVILVRDQTLDEDAQVRFAETFGPPARVTSSRTFSDKHPSVMLVSNIRKDGVPIGALPDGEMHFHTDQCHQPIPAKATMLYAIEIPSKGGNTLFANAYTAYETLPDDIKQRLAGRRALNAYTTDTTLRTAAYDDVRASQWHPAVRTHPATGRKALYVNRLMTREIEGLPREESDATLAMLFDHQEQPQFVYEHVWRPGDILMWDNRCTLHARTDFSAGERRLLRRVTILGEKPV